MYEVTLSELVSPPPTLKFNPTFFDTPVVLAELDVTFNPKDFAPYLVVGIDTTEENNIHIDVSWNSSHLLSTVTDNIEYSIENKTFTISMQKIVLKKQQKIVLAKCGISTIDPADIYNNSNKSDIIFHVSLS